MDGGQSRPDEVEEGVPPPEDDAPPVAASPVTTDMDTTLAAAAAQQQAPKVKMLRIFAEKNPITFRQIEIRGVDGTNCALQSNGGTAAQSSTHMTPRSWNVAWAGRSYPAKNLIDGDRETGNHTQPDANGSWAVVELAEPQHIAEVVIYNSTSTYKGRRHAERAEGHELELVDEHGNACYHTRLSRRVHPELFADKHPKLALCFKKDQLALGRYVCPGIGLPVKISGLRISNSHDNKPIHFRQVEIRGIDGVNHALCSNGGAAEQSSTHHAMARDGSPVGAENLIDGDLSTSNHTHYRGRASATVTLAQPQHIAEVVIYNVPSNDAPYHHAERAEGHELELIDEYGNVLTHIRLSRRFYPGLFGAQPAHTGTEHERKLVLGFTPGALFEARLRLHVMRVLSRFVDEGHAVIDVLRCIEWQLIALLGQRLMLPCIQQWTPGHGRAIENNRVWRNGTTALRPSAA
jgi:hypothetical protein